MFAQLAVGAKTNEIPMLRTLLDTIDITDAVITTNALHCQRETAQAIVEADGHYIFRLDGHDNIAKALHHNARSPHQPVKLLLT